jgi:RNA polymerase sigma factor for flagellar operon FliA
MALKAGDATQRDLLIDHYLPLVKRIAERTCYSLAGHVQVDDLFSSGLLGLLDAMERYTPSKNIKFSTFSSLRIKGAMLDDVRSNDWIPRTARQAYNAYTKARRSLTQSLEREPDDEELRQYLGLEEEPYHKLCREVSLTQMNSLQQLGGMDNDEDNSFDPSDIRDLAQGQKEELKECLQVAISKLPEKKKAALVMYYYEELTLKEIGAVLNVSEGRISQILSEVVAHLKTHHHSQLSSFLEA